MNQSFYSQALLSVVFKHQSESDHLVSIVSPCHDLEQVSLVSLPCSFSPFVEQVRCIMHVFLLKKVLLYLWFGDFYKKRGAIVFLMSEWPLQQEWQVKSWCKRYIKHITERDVSKQREYKGVGLGSQNIQAGGKDTLAVKHQKEKITMQKSLEGCYKTHHIR